MFVVLIFPGQDLLEHLYVVVKLKPKKKCKCKVDKTDDSTKCACVNQSQEDLKMKTEQASEILSAIKKALSDENTNYNSVDHLC